MHEVYKNIEETYIKKAVKRISEIERKRYSLPDVELTELELDTLVAIAEGRNRSEIDKAIRKINKFSSFQGVSQRIIRKFEAFTLVHAACKAVKLGIFNIDTLKEPKM